MGIRMWQETVGEKQVCCPICGEQVNIDMKQVYRQHKTLGVVKDGDVSGSGVCLDCNVSLTYTEEVENATDDVCQLTIIPVDDESP